MCRMLLSTHNTQGERYALSNLEMSIIASCGGAGQLLRRETDITDYDTMEDLPGWVIGKWALVKDIWPDAKIDKPDTTNYAPDKNIYVFEVKK
ncbi:MAG: hypothetical protein GF344_08210 [Chitinivibrionales bacterium]|nr:hypothetical protein [Chitinivibrionales bacterium]MBD3356860.1 hypothetical protein [Chitinivibrionales bacterium]